MIVHLSLWKGRVRIKRSMRDIAFLVAETHGLSVSQLKERTHRHAVAHPRQQAMWIMMQQPGASPSAIARFFGMDHTSVLYGVRAYQKRLDAPLFANPAGEAA